MKSFILALCCLGHLLNAQIPYFNLQFDYQQNLEAAMRGGIETDSNYLFPIKGGSPHANIADSSFLLRINKATGAVQFTKIAYFEGQSVISILSDKDQRLYLQGSNYKGRKEGSNAGNSLYLALLDPNTLDTLALREYEQPGRTMVLYRPILSSDGGIFATGWSFPTQASGRQSLIVFKCDRQLNQRFLKLLPPSTTNNHYGTGAVETPDGGYLIVGSRQVGNPPEFSNALIVKVDSSGNQVFWKEIAHAADTTELYLSGITRHPDGSYLAVGQRIYNPQVGPGWERSWIVNFDANGKIRWSKSYAENERSNWGQIIPSLDGNFFACGYERDFAETPQYKQYATISKLSPTGQLRWHRKYSMEPIGKHFDIFFNVLATSDGGILCSGTSYQNDSTRQNAWVMKLDSLGCSAPGCQTSTGTLALPFGHAAVFTLFPNPTNGVLQIQAQKEDLIDSVRLFTAGGHVVYEDNTRSAHQKSLALNHLPEGSYFCTVQINGSSFIRTIVLVK